MFTGITEEIGQIQSITLENNDKIFTVSTKKILKGKKIGDSITVNGVCTTVTKIQKTIFTFAAIPETLKKTNLDQLKPYDFVNLESSITLEKALDGHIVQGHVDTSAKVIDFKTGKIGARLEVQQPPSIAKYIALKGSITINGVSLTISVLNKNSFCVDLIPHTLKETNLSLLKKGSIVNLEVDIIARYLEKLLQK